MRKDSKRVPHMTEKQFGASDGSEQRLSWVQLPETPKRQAVQHPSSPVSSGGSEDAEILPSPMSDPEVGYMLDVFARTPTLIIAVEETFRVHDINPSTANRLNISREEARTLSCKEVLRCRNLNGTLLCGTSHCPLMRVLQEERSSPSDELFLGARPEVSSEYSVNVVPSHFTGQRGAVFLARDLSALKVANQVRANFVSMVSHELRTPLNSVHGFIDLMMQGHMGSLNDEQRKYLGYAQEGVQQLMAIVEDILFMTRSDSGQFEVKAEKVNVRVLAKQVVTSLRFQALKAAVILEKDIPEPTPLLYADPQRMKQVLNNLVTNAIKFTPPSGTVTIRVRNHPTQKGMALVSVIDTGDGIPLEDQPHVFERFYQSNHAMQSKMGGYGLGLSIARLIVEQHGGQISFESIPQKSAESGEPHGTTFYFTAPLYAGQDEARENSFSPYLEHSE